MRAHKGAPFLAVNALDFGCCGDGCRRRTARLGLDLKASGGVIGAGHCRNLIPHHERQEKPSQPPLSVVTRPTSDGVVKSPSFIPSDWRSYPNLSLQSIL